MIGIPETGTLQKATLSAVSFEGLTAKDQDGRPAKLAIIDEDGNIIESGEAVAKEAWNVAIACFKNFMIGKGYIRVHSSAPIRDSGQEAA